MSSADAFLVLMSGACGAAIVGAINTIVMWVLNRRAAMTDKKQIDIDQLATTVDSLKTAQKSVLQDRLKFLCRSYLKNGDIEMSDRQDLIAMHEAYHGLGGNGNLDDLMEQARKLKIRH